jgi:hypothetical protein
VLAYLLLAAGQAAGLVVTALAWPGVWIQLLALAAFAWMTNFEVVGTVPLALLFIFTLISEILGAIISRRGDNGARRRIAVVALAGGVAGAATGIAVPLLGGLFGAFIGAILGAAVAGIVLRRKKLGEGLPGQVLALGMRSATGVIVAAFILLTLIR